VAATGPVPPALIRKIFAAGTFCAARRQSPAVMRFNCGRTGERRRAQFTQGAVFKGAHVCGAQSRPRPSRRADRVSNSEAHSQNVLFRRRQFLQRVRHPSFDPDAVIGDG